ncbi:MAG: hypothetical protein JXA25_13470 [Anaerolineales bacterium]|nr:hypothetical protein [Anaerolineales bacterium]
MLEQQVELYQEEGKEEQETARKVAEQDVSIEAGIGNAALLIETITGDPRIMGILAEKGYNEEVFNEGRTLLENARSAFASRAAAIAAQRYASSRLAGTEISAEKAFTDFRLVARAVFKDEPEAFSALNLKDSLPPNRSQFIARALTAIENARLEEYTGRLSRFGCDEEGLAQVEASISALETTDAGQNQLISDAMTATAERDAAWEALSGWVSQLRAVAKTALRDKPDLVKILDV